MQAKEYIVTLDDDPMIFKIIEKVTNIRSLPFSSAENLLKRAPSYKPIAAFIDIKLGLNDCGLDIIPELRKYWNYVPIIVITSDPSQAVIGQALASGANDFIKKPLNPDELTARLRARIAEMNEKQNLDTIQIGDATFSFRNRCLQANDYKTYLSPMAAQILMCLTEAKGMTVPKKILKRKIWGQIAVSDNALDRRLSELRKSLSEVSDSLKIRSIYGTGIILETENNTNVVNLNPPTAVAA